MCLIHLLLDRTDHKNDGALDLADAGTDIEDLDDPALLSAARSLTPTATSLLPPSTVLRLLSLPSGHAPRPYSPSSTITHHTVRALGHLLELPPAAFSTFCHKLGTWEDKVPWVTHPWTLEDLECDV